MRMRNLRYRLPTRALWQDVPFSRVAEAIHSNAGAVLGTNYWGNPLDSFIALEKNRRREL